MEFIDKLKTDALEGWGGLKSHYEAIKSPIVRLAVLIAAVLVAIVLFFHFLPWIILLAVVGGISFAVHSALTSEDD